MGESEDCVEWTAIVVTCSGKTRAHAIQRELLLHQRRGLLPSGVLLLTVEDPQDHVGSGGATLNALLTVTEHLSARHGDTVVNGDLLSSSHIMILHIGRDFPLSGCAQAFTPVSVTRSTPLSCQSVLTNLDLLVHQLTYQLSVGAPPGVWVSSTDMLLDLPENISRLDLSAADACVVTTVANMDYARRHGVYKVSDTGILRDIIFQGSEADIAACVNKDGTFNIVSGVVYFSATVAERFLALHVTSPLDACTYMGLDSGNPPIQLSLFFDVMLCMCLDISETDFVSGTRSSLYGRKRKLDADPKQHNVSRARQQLWKELHSRDVHDCSMKSSENQLVCSVVEEDAHIGDGVHISHSHLDGHLHVADRCWLNNIDTTQLPPGTMKLSADTVLQRFTIRVNNTTHSCHVIFGTKDVLNTSLTGGDVSSTFCNKPWSQLFERTGIKAQDLWHSAMEPVSCSLLTARLFPVVCAEGDPGMYSALWLAGSEAAPHLHMLAKWHSSWRLSLSEILSLSDWDAEFEQRRQLFQRVSSRLVCMTLQQHGKLGLYSLYQTAAVDGHATDILNVLDKVCMECQDTGVMARTLANIADMLGAMANRRGGLRSGPAANTDWIPAFKLLEAGDLANGARTLSHTREQWMDSDHRLVRAARHYERAAQILIRHAVMSARQFISTQQGSSADQGVWVCAECPARVDIAGGWSDTPPITYEHGGAVINAAITIDGKKPIGCKVRRISEPVLLLSVDPDEHTTVTVTKLSQMEDYCQPQAPGALLKAAFLCAEVVKLPSTTSLQDQLLNTYGGGFEVVSWSNLPQGSGLGTSSILAGAVMAAIWRAAGKSFDISSLIHGVLHLEQMLTTGGGWQDQVGGLTGGIKVGHSPAALPLRVDITFPCISAETTQAFSDRLVLVYTGKTRLARNLLQNVVRNWYARDPEIVQTEDALVATAWDCAAAFEQGNLVEVGKYMELYWTQKKHMAPGCEPQAVSSMMSALHPYSLGMAMAGAGGGGFLYVLTHDADDPVAIVTKVLASNSPRMMKDISIHKGRVDTDGLTLTVDGQPEQWHRP